jgi:hypothetical protein
MAIPAICRGHFSRVRFMALGALRGLAVHTMTSGTVQGSMLAPIVSELSNLPGMAGKTGVRNIVRESNIQRSMRVSVAVEAASDLEMGLCPMALAALRDGFLYQRRMSDVAGRAPHAPVLSAGGSYVGRRRGVALFTVFVCHYRLFFGARRG